MASQSSKKVIYAALAGNALIAATKFVASGITGSVAISDMETAIKATFPEVTRVFIEVQSWSAHLAWLKRGAAPEIDTRP